MLINNKIIIRGNKSICSAFYRNWVINTKYRMIPELCVYIAPVQSYDSSKMGTTEINNLRKMLLIMKFHILYVYMLMWHCFQNGFVKFTMVCCTAEMIIILTDTIGK